MTLYTLSKESRSTPLNAIKDRKRRGATRTTEAAKESHECHGSPSCTSDRVNEVMLYQHSWENRPGESLQSRKSTLKVSLAL
jgi:hypothetical protein